MHSLFVMYSGAPNFPAMFHLNQTTHEVEAVIPGDADNGNVVTKLIPTPRPDPNGNHIDVRSLKHSRTWFAGLYTCFQPIIDRIQWAKPSPTEDARWEINFEEIHSLEYLASGAQGMVYRGRFRDREVAVKKVNDLKDAECMRKLSRHPNIVDLYGVCITPCCVVMEYCPVGSLADFLRSKRPLGMTLQRVFDWSRQVARGMNHLHSRKILHRDLKSANVLIAGNNTLKITDFGTSRDWSSVDSNDSVFMTFAGTIPWMAPEMIRSERCSDKVDVWSYGVVLWELLTCDVPYKEIPLPAILYGVGSGSLCLAIPQQCPAGLELLLRLCWAPKPRNRPGFPQILVHLDIAEREIGTQTTTANALVDPNANSATFDDEPDVDVKIRYEQRLKETTDLFFKLSTFLQRLERNQKYESVSSLCSTRRYSF